MSDKPSAEAQLHICEMQRDIAVAGNGALTKEWLLTQNPAMKDIVADNAVQKHNADELAAFKAYVSAGQKENSPEYNRLLETATQRDAYVRRHFSGVNNHILEALDKYVQAQDKIDHPLEYVSSECKAILPGSSK